MKTQTIRLVDVFVLGPFMVWYASASTRMHPAARLALGASGLATIAYNGLNYLQARAEEQLVQDVMNPKPQFAGYRRR